MIARLPALTEIVQRTDQQYIGVTYARYLGQALAYTHLADPARSPDFVRWILPSSWYREHGESNSITIPVPLNNRKGAQESLILRAHTRYVQLAKAEHNGAPPEMHSTVNPTEATEWYGRAFQDIAAAMYQLKRDNQPLQ